MNKDPPQAYTLLLKLVKEHFRKPLQKREASMAVTGVGLKYPVGNWEVQMTTLLFFQNNIFIKEDFKKINWD